MKDKNKIGLFALIMLIFVPTFGFSSMAANVVALGPAAIPSYIIVALLFFLPLTIMIAELSSVNQDKEGGIYSWVECSLGRKWAFISTWSYFIANLFFLQYVFASLPIMFSWMIFGENRFNDSSTTLVVVIGIALVILLTYIGTLGVKTFAKISDIGGKLTLVATVLFIIFAIAGVLFGKAPSATQFTFESVIPKFNSEYFSTFAWLILAVAGAEVAGTYIKDVDNPKKNFPKGVIIATVLIALAYILGSLGVCFVSSQDALTKAGLDDVNFVVYKILGDNWGISGKLVVQIYAVIFTITAIAKYVVWIESPLRAMFSEIPSGTFPNFLTKKRQDGTLVNALWLQCGIIIAMLIIPVAGFKSINNFFILLQNLSALSCVIPYIILIVAYYVFRKKNNEPPFMLMKSKAMVNIIFLIAFIMSILAFFGAGWEDIAGAKNLKDGVFMIARDYGGPIILVLVGALLVELTKLYYRHDAKRSRTKSI